MTYTFTQDCGNAKQGDTVKFTKKHGFKIYRGRKSVAAISTADVANYIEKGLLKSDVDPDEVQWDMTEVVSENESLEKAKNSYLRDRFAMSVLPVVYSGARDEDSIDDIAVRCYRMADAMLKARG